MSSIELKSKVFQELEKVDDYILEEILSLIQIETDQDKIVKIPKHYKEALDKSIVQMESGDMIPNEDLENTIEHWLYK